MNTKLLRWSWVVLGLCAGISAGQAAETVRWANLASRIDGEKMGFKHGGYRVITVAGEQLVGDQLKFTDLGVHVMPSRADVPRDQVKEIRLRRGRRLGEALLSPAVGTGLTFLKAFSGADGNVVLYAAYDFPAMAAEISVGAPIVLTIEGVKRLLPDKVIRVTR